MTSVNIRQIPFVGGTAYHAGQVLDLIMEPCNIDPTISVLAAFNYTPMILWGLLKPTPVDYLTDRFGGLHSKKRKRKFEIRDVTIMSGGGSGAIGWAAASGIALTEKIGWYFLVADVAANFAVNWTSMMYQFSGCNVAGAPWAKIRDPNGLAGTSNVNPFILSGATFRSSFIWPTDSVHINANTIGPKVFSGSAKFRPSNINPKGTITKVEVVGNNGFQMDLTQGPDEGAGRRWWTGAKRVYSSFALPQIANIQVWSTGGLWVCTEWQLTGSGTLDKGFEPDP